MKIMEDLPPVDQESILSCMEGPASAAAYHDSVNGSCAACGIAIHFATTAPRQFIKLCRACTLLRIEKDGHALDAQVTETTILEVFGQLGIEDTQENRAKVMQTLSSGRLMDWLRQGVANEPGVK